MKRASINRITRDDEGRSYECILSENNVIVDRYFGPCQEACEMALNYVDNDLERISWPFKNSELYTGKKARSKVGRIFISRGKVGARTKGRESPQELPVGEKK